jgi:hypothetical protein
MSQPLRPGGKRSDLLAVRWPGWVATAALAAVWIGLSFIPGLRTNWIWLARAAIFFIAAGVLWLAYDPAEPDEGV